LPNIPGRPAKHGATAGLPTPKRVVDGAAGVTSRIRPVWLLPGIQWERCEALPTETWTGSPLRIRMRPSERFLKIAHALALFHYARTIGTYPA
jgi:hypothetical protein